MIHMLHPPLFAAYQPLPMHLVEQIIQTVFQQRRDEQQRGPWGEVPINQKFRPQKMKKQAKVPHPPPQQPKQGANSIQEATFSKKREKMSEKQKQKERQALEGASHTQPAGETALQRL